jgi:hypothetical protein
MNKRQEKKQRVICLPYPNKKVPRKRIIHRLKKTAFAGYSYIDTTTIRLSTKHPWRYKGIKKKHSNIKHITIWISYSNMQRICAIMILTG